MTTGAIITAVIGSAIALKFMDAYDRYINKYFRSDKSHK